MLKRFMIVALLVGGFTAVSATEANAWILRRRAPVRRAVRAVAPPYPVARRVVAGPVVRRRPVVVARPVVYASPAPVVSVGVGYGGYYGW